MEERENGGVNNNRKENEGIIQSGDEMKYGGEKEFYCQWTKFWEEFGSGRKMVLSTSLNDQVTSRMMSVVQQGGTLYFQTDCTFRKYKQLKENEKAALCIDNIQIEGTCRVIGHPREHEVFMTLFKEHFMNSYERYTHLSNERLFEFTPSYVKRWIYRDGIPYEEIYEVTEKAYKLIRYQGE